VTGCEHADSWATDAHKTLNVPYDNGLAIVRDAAALRASMGMRGAYLIHDERGEPLDKVPEVSRRGRAFPVWAALRSLPRSRVGDLVDRFCRHATAFAAGLADIPEVTVLNDVDFTQVCVTLGTDERTEEVVRKARRGALTPPGDLVLRSPNLGQPVPGCPRYQPPQVMTSGAPCHPHRTKQAPPPNRRVRRGRLSLKLRLRCLPGRACG
jgi:glutamate/tyrosine decarboxylase-like PLP-dependent enzyme